MPYITIDDKRTVIVTAGIDGEIPPPDIQIDVQSLINTKVQDILDMPRTEEIASIRTSRATERQKEELGWATMNIIKVFVDTDMETVPVGIKNKIGSTVKSELERLNFNVTEVETVIE